MIRYYCDGCEEEIKFANLERFQCKVELPSRANDYGTGRYHKMLCTNCQANLWFAFQKILGEKT